MSIELIPLCTIDVTMGEQIFVGPGPAGMRVVAEVEDAAVTGERLNARFRGRAGADWLVVNGTVGSVDVRVTFETHDGALIFVTYGGRLDLTNGPGAAPIYIAPVFETADERYAWLNLVQAVGKGVLDGTRLVYELYEVR